MTYTEDELNRMFGFFDIDWELDLSLRGFKDIPYDYIPIIERLKSLNLGQNNITSFSGFDAPKLEVLRIYGNQFTDLNNLGNLESLETLDISGNDLTKIRNLEYVPKLKNLVSMFNLVTEVDVRNLKELERLCLYFARIESLDDIQAPDSLKELYIQNTPMFDFNNISRFKNLEILDISGTPILNYEEILKLPKLKEVHLNDTRAAETYLSVFFAKGVKAIRPGHSGMSDTLLYDSLKKLVEVKDDVHE